jgi:flagellar capping protein FliD
MSSIQLSGLNSGLDTQSIIAQLMAVEKRKLTLYTNKKTDYQEKQTAISEVKSKVSTLNNAVKALANADNLKAFDVSTSDSDMITAEATNSAYEGNHTIVVNQLAKAQRMVHTDGLSYAEDYVGAGSFIYSYNHHETNLTTTADTTLQDLVDMINNDANNPGVTASLLNYNDKYHLVLNGQDAGSDYAVSINPTTTRVLEAASELTYNGDNATTSTKLVNLEQFGGTRVLTGTETITISGTNHAGDPITSATFDLESNTTVENLISRINAAFNGVAEARFEDGKIVLVDDTYGTSGLSVSLTYNPNGSGATLSLPTMAVTSAGGEGDGIDTFEHGDFTISQEAQNSKIKVDGYPAGDTNFIERSSNTISDVIEGVTLHLHDLTDDTGEEITLTRNTEDIKSKIETLVATYNDAVEKITEYTKYDSSTKTAGVLMSDYTISSIRQQIRLPIIGYASGFAQDVDDYASAVSIGLTVDKDGVMSFDGNKFDEAVSDNYAAVLAVIGANKTGESTSTKVQYYNDSETYTTAGQYDVDIKVTGGAIEYARIKLATESTWRNMTVDGNIVTGNSEFDTNGNPLYAENGLQLSVDLSTDATYTPTVRIKQGFAGTMKDSIADMTKSSTGTLAIDEDHVGDQIDLLQDRIDRENDRLDKYQERLVARYARLEATLTLLQQQMSALTGSSS